MGWLLTCGVGGLLLVHLVLNLFDMPVRIWVVDWHFFVFGVLYCCVCVRCFAVWVFGYLLYAVLIVTCCLLFIVCVYLWIGYFSLGLCLMLEWCYILCFYLFVEGLDWL